MLISPTTQKIIIVTVVLLLLGLFGYNIFFVDSGIPPEPADLSNTDIAGQDILSLVEKLKEINIDQSIFSSPLINNLVDIEVPLYPESQGRVNPFAKIGTDLTITPGFMATTTVIKNNSTRG